MQAHRISENFLAPLLGSSGHELAELAVQRLPAGINASHRDECREAPIALPPNVRQAHRLADPLDVLEARAWARAYLWAHGDLEDLLDAVDPLQAYAERSGLIDRLGQDHVQHLIAAAFAPYRGRPWC